MKIAVVVSRFLLGFIFAFFGLNGFFEFVPAEAFPRAPEAAEKVIHFLRTSFLMELLCAGHVIGGLLLMINRFVPFALALLFPQLVTALTFHFLLDPGLASAGTAYLSGILFVFLGWAYRRHFESLFYAKADPEG